VIKDIRENHNIIGVPVGTLLQLPTQNVFLGTPFEYSPEEIALLNSRNVIKVVNGRQAAQKDRAKPRRQLKSSPYGMFLEFPKEWRRKGKLLPEPAETNVEKSVAVKSKLELSEDIPKMDEGIMFRVYEYLNKAGYWMIPGLRFGCQYTAYPGDLLRFHSHFLVHVEKEEEEKGIEMLSLVGGGRVATQTRKAWMLAGQVDGEVRVFTIEWAGFG
jgi:tRNA-splicing endonuclease subunit Sen34